MSTYITYNTVVYLRRKKHLFSPIILSVQVQILMWVATIPHFKVESIWLAQGRGTHTITCT